METDRNFLLRIRDRERKLITKIDRALERIDDGSFGFCNECGEDIEIKRLEARPVATLCIECKTNQEEEEKLTK
jgi:DnaK suppressor protein